MWNLVYLLIASGIATLAVHLLRQVRAPEAPAPRTRATAGSAQRIAARTAPAAAQAPLMWEDPADRLPALDGSQTSERLQARYIAARFHGLVSSVDDLRRIDHVIRCARLSFEEDKYDLAYEMLHMAIAQSPSDEPLRLAQLEIAFLQRDTPHFVALAEQFRAARPRSPNWPEIGRLGRALAPDEPMFAAGPGSRPHEHYGPWPDLPNWIQASWDLTAEVLAADFRRAMLRAPAVEHAASTKTRLAVGA